MKHIDPGINLTSYNCPHCGAHAQQFWGRALWDKLNDGDTPSITTKADLGEILKNIESAKDLPADEANNLESYFRKRASGQPFVEELGEPVRSRNLLVNVSVSRCYNCKGIAFWIHDRLIWPAFAGSQVANDDMPDDIRLDFEEASRIYEMSPRGAAALLRLCIQKLVVHLSLTGDNLNAAIGELVKRGLNVRIQQALDIVRVIGNNAVHPGQIDLRDDRETADELFRLVNLITDATISQPRRIEGMYSRLPEAARKAIEARDKKKP